jgi:DNA adenine methylase/adenine-specific DNA-methyltransferase
MTGHTRAVAIAALCLAAARRQPRGVFTISGDLSRYDDGRRDLRLSLREHFVERVADYHRAVVEGAAACSVSTGEVGEVERDGWDLVYLDPPYAPVSDDNDYTKRFHFLEGLSRYWEGDEVMWGTRTRKLPKRVTGFSSRRTIEQALGTVLDTFRDSPLVLSYSSHAEPDRATLVGMLREVKGAGSVEVRTVPHTYSYGTHRAAVRRRVEELVLVAV